MLVLRKTWLSYVIGPEYDSVWKLKEVESIPYDHMFELPLERDVYLLEYITYLFKMDFPIAETFWIKIKANKDELKKLRTLATFKEAEIVISLGEHKAIKHKYDMKETHIPNYGQMPFLPFKEFESFFKRTTY